jgi:periodic tryptophan protein 2
VLAKGRVFDVPGVQRICTWQNFVLLLLCFDECHVSDRILAVGSKDMSVRLYSLEKFANFKTYSLGSHTDSVVACFFERGSLDLTTIGRNGQLCVWECSIDIDSLQPWEPPVKKTRQETNSDGEDDVDTSRAEENRAVEEVTAGKLRF